MFIPIRTESEWRRYPRVNVCLIGLNVVFFLLFGDAMTNPAMAAFRTRYLEFFPTQPALHQFVTYQFLHAHWGHLLGNMLILWVFGNSVNGKMGDLPYLLFYLAAGVFAAWGFAVVQSSPVPMVGASGAIAGITTAYLILFPRSHVTVLVWLFVFIHFIEVPAFLLIVAKIIFWDNLLRPSVEGAGQVAYHAHLAGYVFGLTAALGMLLLRALPRDRFDALAVWKQWRRKREFASVMRGPNAQARAQFGRVARVGRLSPEQQAAAERHLDAISDLRAKIALALEQNRTDDAMNAYGQLIAQDPQQCMSEAQQLVLGRAFYSTGRFPQAATSFERFVACYPHSAEAVEVTLLLGIIFARDLHQYERADELLTESLKKLSGQTRRRQCHQWLTKVREALGRPLPAPWSG